MKENARDSETIRQRAAVDAMRRAAEDPDKRELMALFAAYRKGQLDAYVAAGFTREEAFALVLQEIPE